MGAILILHCSVNLLLLALSVHCYPHGAPEVVCNSFLPEEPHPRFPSVTPSPYSLVIPSQQHTLGEQLSGKLPYYLVSYRRFHNRQNTLIQRCNNANDVGSTGCLNVICFLCHTWRFNRKRIFNRYFSVLFHTACVKRAYELCGGVLGHVIKWILF